MDDKGNSEIENVNDNHMNYNSPNMSSDWRFGGMGLVSTGNTMESSCTSASFCPPIWDHPSNLPNMALCDFITQNNTSTSNSIGIRRGGERKIDMGMFFPQSLSQYPADSDFIERAARFSCFGGGNFGDMMNNFGFPLLEKEVFAGIGLTSKMAQVAKDVSLSAEHESFVRSNNEAKQGARKSDNESDEAELSGGGGGQEEPSVLEGGDGEPSSTKGLGSKKRKRKRIFKDPELDQVKGAPQPPDEVTNDDTKIQGKGDQKAASTSDMPIGKNGSQASDGKKDEYIHIRARRGQATNSHSLAERVRREKISERMKFLQDLVPGCSKVTGKAVMLDEIINYVQSLQRQVEFLSMKLATVNPRLDSNIDGLLTKDILQSRARPSSAVGFSPDVTIPFPMLNSSQPGLIQTGLTSMANSSDGLQRAMNSSDGLQRTINSQLMAVIGGYKDPTPQVPNSWEDELNNVVQMAFNSSAPLDGRDLSGSLPQGHTKVEL